MSTGRARGKHTPRPPEIRPGDPEGREMGMSDRVQGYPSPIPGGKTHVTNAPSVRNKVPIADARPEITDLNAHGVQPGTMTSRERAEVMRGPNSIHAAPVPASEHGAGGQPATAPVPVYIVETASPPEVMRSAAPHHFQLQASTGEGVRLCGRDRKRVRIGLLNESTSSNIRFAKDLRDLTNGGGSLLPWPSNTYLFLTTQDELWGISADSGTPVVSVIQEYDQPW